MYNGRMDNWNKNETYWFSDVVSSATCGLRIIVANKWINENVFSEGHHPRLLASSQPPSRPSPFNIVAPLLFLLRPPLNPSYPELRFITLVSMQIWTKSYQGFSASQSRDASLGEVIAELQTSHKTVIPD
ncbi:unnamed protein product [Lactuca virosa]|uniref:Uncharacterized protein n=1 Tax=Lactuca virosa TaxID=75947 RepID=A0AAU9NIH1_9ASTR|nr:unnamed protein product [Lactuca virosa]